MRAFLVNLGMVIAVSLYALVRGKATRVPQRVGSVLIVQTAKMGDMVCATPVLHAVRAQFPDAHITVLGDAVGKQVLADSPDVDDYIVSENTFLSLVKQIRRARFDASSVLVPDGRSIALAFLGGARFIDAPEVVDGYCPWQTKTYRLLLRLVHTEKHHMGRYAPGEYLRLLVPLGIQTTDTTKRLAFSEAARKNALAFLREHSLQEKKFAIISPSAGNKIKNWPAERFAQVAEHLVAKGMPVVVIGGSRDTEEVAAMMEAVENPANITDASTRFSIDELKAVIACAGLFIAVDTGPVYIAEAFDVPTIDIVGPVDEREQPPVGPKHIVVVPDRSAPAVHIMNARMYDKVEARRQTEAITVKEVLDAAGLLIDTAPRTIL